MSKDFSCFQTLSLPFDASAELKVSEYATGHHYIEGDGGNEIDGKQWRFLTADEEAIYADAHAHARADDDGMGAAIGAITAAEDNDLGADWGAFDQGPAEVDPDVARINEVMASTEHAMFDGGRGLEVKPGVERALADQAIRFINEAVGDSRNTRYTLVVYHMDPETFNAETTGAAMKSYSLVSTGDRRALADVAYQEMVNAFAEQGDGLFDGSTTLDVE